MEIYISHKWIDLDHYVIFESNLQLFIIFCCQMCFCLSYILVHHLGNLVTNLLLKRHSPLDDQQRKHMKTPFESPINLPIKTYRCIYIYEMLLYQT